GDTVQHTTTGTLVLRHLDGRIAFTDGSRTWIQGPNGIEVRGNNERFLWEPSPTPTGLAALPSAGTPTAGTPAAGTPAAAGTGTPAGATPASTPAAATGTPAPAKPATPAPAKPAAPAQAKPASTTPTPT